MTIKFSKPISLWPSAQISQKQDELDLYLILLEDLDAFENLDAPQPQADAEVRMTIITAKVGDSFYANVFDEDRKKIINKQKLTGETLFKQLTTYFNDDAINAGDLEIINKSQIRTELIKDLTSALCNQLDIYFQPGLTWTQQGTQGVALLFLENHAESGDNKLQDFRELVKGLVRWVWAAAEKDENTNITQKVVQALYDKFVTTKLSYVALRYFLSTHYRFNVQKCDTEMEGTVFPMFPNLEMIVGSNPSVNFSPDQKELDANKIEILRKFYAQLQVKFGTANRVDTIDASSVTAFLFVGYARLLIRNGLQAIIDHLKNGGDADNIVKLLNELKNDSYINIAGMASRFLLNGFNLPEHFFGKDDPTADEGLYVSTGQQYRLIDSRVTSSSKSKSKYQVTLLQKDNPENFILFAGNSPQLTLAYSIPDQNSHPFLILANAFKDLAETDVTKLHSAQPKLIPPYRKENLHFALRNRVDWLPQQDSGSTSYLLPLPTTLLNHLEQHTPNPLVDLRVWNNNDPAQAIDIPNDNFTWATRIDLTLQRIPNPDGGGFLKETYEIGSSSEKDKDLLEAIWNFLNIPTETDPVDLSFLYVSDEGGTTNPTVKLVPGSQDNILLLKANLSTETTGTSPTDFSAKLSEKTDFLKLLLKALDVDTGGFYLHIPHGDTSLDAAVFKSDNSAVVPFLIQFTEPADPIYDFNNYAVFTAAIDVETDLVLARSDKSIPVLTIPPGFLGFQIDDRPEAQPDGNSEQNNGEEELNVLYQLLGWQVAENTLFKESNPGLPIGPTELPGSNGTASDKWLYERLVPVFSRVANTSTTGSSGLPPQAMNPYLGIGEDSELKVRTWWQDIYGNQLLASQAAQVFPIRYTDSLLGINQWPSVSENYTFFGEPGNVTLRLTFSFDPAPYALASHTAAQDSAASRRNRIEGDKATIEKVYYQLIQGDVDFTVITSIGGGWTPSDRDNALIKQGIQKFVADIYRYLTGSLNEDGSINNNPVNGIPDSYIQDIDASEINIRPSFIFPVTVEIEIARKLALVSNDLKSNGNIKDEYANVLRAPATLNPKFEAISNSDEGLNLRSFAQDFQEAFPGLLLGVSEDRQNRNRSGISQQPLYAVRLGVNGITYDIQEGQPTYYAIPPLANVLLSGTVPIQNYTGWKGDIPDDADLITLSYDPKSENSQFDAIDLNVLARSFLVALESFLNPATLVPAYRLFPEKVDSILKKKETLAKVLSDHILPVLHDDAEKINTPGFPEAREAIRQELLVDLVNGYDIETIVQFDVKVTVADAVSTSDWELDFEPRIRGKAKVNSVKVGEDPNNRESISLSTLDFKLSTGKIHLRRDNGTSYFTYLFDTKTPELFANLELDLQFVPTEIEQASNFLNFVLPEGLDQSMGSSAIPIPLREYPPPPSLIFQRAEPDPTSRTNLADVRQWQYTIVYEHLDISQDSIDCILQLNVPPVDNQPTESGKITNPEPGDDLFSALVNFGEIYPQIAADFNSLRSENLFVDESLQKTAAIAIHAFEFLVTNIANEWGEWATDPKIYAPTKSDLHFVISEEALEDRKRRQGLVTVLQTVASKIGGPAIIPTLALPGYEEKGEPDISSDGKITTFTFERNPEDLTFFGESSIPDRKLTIENLDVIEHQNAWASVWLSRNKDLIRTIDGDGPLATNPAFIFQTPAVRFSNMVTPFITNDEPWDIATLGASDNTPKRTLKAHLTKMLEILFPTEGNKYEVQLSCRYAFSLATGKGLNEDLVTTLPILLGLQITPEDLAVDNYATKLCNEIQYWLTVNQPSTEWASLMFTVDLFSKLNDDSNTSLPMLRITKLRLKLEQISNLNQLLVEQ